MKALSMTPPYGQLIRDGKKTIETRTWNTWYRGPILFVCAKKPASPEAGMALCVAELLLTRHMQPEDEMAACCSIYPDAIAWVLRNVRRVVPFPVKGQLGLFNVPDELIVIEGAKL
ncbi:MAG: ASCH domain-containing protein [Chloroflexi bacterium]|nr:ASCH domain-containing protein [Chloroflexota bacterium]